jgi:hypothetical protein
MGPRNEKYIPERLPPSTQQAIEGTCIAAAEGSLEDAMKQYDRIKRGSLRRKSEPQTTEPVHTSSPSMEKKRQETL